MLAAAAAWLATKSGAIKWVGLGLAALLIVGLILGGFFYVSNLQESYAKAKADLAAETLQRQLADARADDIMTQHSLQVVRIEALETQRTEIIGEVVKLRAEINDLNIEEDIESGNDAKAEAALADLRRSNARLNRLLEQSSNANNLRAPAGPAGKAGTPRAR